MDITHLVAKRSTCLRRQVGAVLVKDKKILATGYNGAPSRVEHCLDIGCLRERERIPSGERHELCEAAGFGLERADAQQVAGPVLVMVGVPVHDRDGAPQTRRVPSAPAGAYPGRRRAHLRRYDGEAWKR